jgi:nicotinamidase/pyrazinamidase
MTKRALIIVDPQVDFITGSLAVTDAKEIIPIINKIDKSLFDCVIITMDYHPKKHISFASTHNKKLFSKIKLQDGSFQELWPDHCVQNTHGSDLYSELDLNFPNLYFFKKGENFSIDSYSGFFENDKKTSTGLEEFLKSRNIEATYICGLATDVCVKYTAIDSEKCGFTTFVIMDACKGINPNLENTMYTLMDKGITLIDSVDLI